MTSKRNPDANPELFKDAIPAPISREPRCEEKKHNAQCVRNVGHKGLHMANSQGFVLTWET